MITFFAATLIAGSPALVEPVAAKDALIREIIDIMLDGRDLGPDVEQRIRALPPEERLDVLIVLRRSGMLTGPTWPIERILAP